VYKEERTQNFDTGTVGRKKVLQHTVFFDFSGFKGLKKLKT